MTQRPIFVVGTMRSGSTLFRLVLDSHPNIAISEETGFMGALVATKTVPGWHHGHGWFGRLGWSENEFHRHLREFYTTMFERYADEQGKPRWGEKTPFHSQHIALMAEVFPDAVFVAITRHPGAVVHSLMQKFHYGAADASTYWTRTNADILRRGAALGGERFALLRYEDLVLHPEPLLRELTDWLGEPWSDDVLRHNEVQAEKAAPRISAGNTRTRDPIRSELGERWAGALSAAQRGEMVTITGTIAEFLGYDPGRQGEPGRPAPQAVGATSMLLTGDVLAERMRSRPQPFTEEPPEEIVHPDMDATELAARLRRAERAVARIRSRRVIRWTNAVQRAGQRVSGLPLETLTWARRRLRPASGRR